LTKRGGKFAQEKGDVPSIAKHKKWDSKGPLKNITPQNSANQGPQKKGKRNHRRQDWHTRGLKKETVSKKSPLTTSLEKKEGKKTPTAPWEEIGRKRTAIHSDRKN